MAAKYNWIVGMNSTVGAQICLERVYGTENEMKRFLIKLAKANAQESKDRFEYCTETTDEVEACTMYDGSITLNAYCIFADFEVYYTARTEVPAVDLKEVFSLIKSENAWPFSAPNTLRLRKKEEKEKA